MQLPRREPPQHTGRGASRVFVLGSTGTIGRATVRALLVQGHQVVCFQRRRGASGPAAHDNGAETRFGDATDPLSIARDGFCGERFDVLVSCMASRTGSPADAWAIDHQAHVHAMNAAQDAGVGQMVLLSAICVQKPRLAIHFAKLAFEKALAESSLTYSIVRPTAYFKSLSGQIERLRRGKPFLMFGDGRQTACKPISDDDLARFLTACIDDPTKHNRILPIGGPGDAITPREQGEHLFALLGRKPKFQKIPLGLVDSIVGGLGVMARLVPPLSEKAEFGRIAQYYATESMLLWDDAAGRYDAAATPSFGSDSLFDYYARLIADEAKPDLGDHAMF